jgi:hydroxypyruvate isomerase
MNGITRRDLLKRVGAGAAGAVAWPAIAASGQAAAPQKVVKNGRLKQSVTRWPYARIPAPEFYRAVADMGLTAVDLLRPNEWADLKPYGLTCSMAYAGSDDIGRGFNNPANHDAMVQALTQNIPLAAKAGIPNVIAFFGNVQPNMTEAQAIDTCVAGFNRIKNVAEDSG